MIRQFSALLIAFSLTPLLCFAGEAEELPHVAPALIPFSDNFTRPYAESDPWLPVSGTWRVEHAVERSRIDRFGKVFGGWRGNWDRLRQAGLKEWAQRASNLSQYVGENGIALTGQPDWTDYRFSANARSVRGSVGLVFGWRDEENHYKSGWSLVSVAPHAARFWVAEVSIGRRRELAAVYLEGATTQWYRFAVATRNGVGDRCRLEVFLDGHRVFDRYQDDKIRGKVGVFASGQGHFDDVEVIANPRFAWDTKQACEAGGRAASGRWAVTEGAEDTPGRELATLASACIRPVSSGDSRFALRNPVAGASHLECGVRFGREAKAVGCKLLGPHGLGAAFRIENGGTAIRLTRAGSRRARQVVLAEAPAALAPNEWHRLEVALRDQHLQVYLNGQLELRAAHWEFPLNEVQLLARDARQSAFRSPAVNKDRPEDRARRPAGHWYVVDPFMQHWANPAGAWVSSHSGHTTTLPQSELWHKSDFFGAAEVTIPLSQNSGIFLAADDPKSRRRYEVRITGAPRGGAGRPPFPVKRIGVQLVRAGKVVVHAALELAAASQWSDLIHEADTFFVPFLSDGRADLDPPITVPALQAALPKLMGSKRKLALGWPEGMAAEKLSEALEACRAAGVRNVTVQNPPPPRHTAIAGGLRFNQPLSEITVHRDGRYVWVTVGGRELLSFRDPEPLPGRRVGVFAGAGIEPGQIRVERGQVKDYLFEEAISGWQAIGNWEIYNRFDCDPRWYHLVCKTDSSAILWNKHEFIGDFTLEYYIGNRMCPSPMGWYSRMGDYNAMLCSNGRDLDRGYAVIVGAWDKSWTGRTTKMLREGKEVASTDRQVVPVARPISPVRPIWEPIIAPGRDTHGAWYHIKVRRIGGKIEVWYDNELLLDYEDPEPLAGARIGLWTMQNFVVLARAQISYEKSRVPAPRYLPPPDDIPESASPEQPSFRIASTTHPGLFSDFETGLQGWSSGDGNRSLMMVARPDAGHSSSYLKVTNLYRGGSLSLQAPVKPPVDLVRARRLSFDYRIEPGTQVNLYLKARGRRYLVRMTGPHDPEDRVPLLATVEGARADGKWRHAEIDLAGPLLELQPFVAGLPLEELAFGDLAEGYHLAGLGGAKPGDSFCIDNVRIVSLGGAEARLSWTGHGADECEFSAELDQEMSTVPDDEPDLRESGKTFADLKDGTWCFHVKSRRLGHGWSRPMHYCFEVDSRPFGLVGAVPKPDGPWRGETIQVHYGPGTSGAPDFDNLDVWVNGRALPRVSGYRYDWSSRTLAIDPRAAGVALPDGSDLEVRLVTRDQEGALIKDWHVIGPFDNAGCEGFDRIYPPEEKVDLEATHKGLDGKPARWEECHTDNGFVDFNKFWNVGNVVAYATATVEFKEGPVKTQIGLGSDDGVKAWVNGRLVHSNHTHRGYRADQDRFDVTFEKGENRILVKVDQGGGGWNFGLKIRGWKTVERLAYKVDVKDDRLPPGRVRLVQSSSLPAGYPVNEDFEAGIGAFRALGGQVTQSVGNAAEGKGSLCLMPEILGGPVGAYVALEPFPLGKYPLLAFDYRMPERMYLNFGLHADGKNVGLLFTDEEPGIPISAKLPDVAPTKQWRRSELNLWRQLVGSDLHCGAMGVKELKIADFGYRGNLEGLRVYFDNIRFVPAVRSADGLELAWEARDDGAIAGYSFVWDGQASTVPDEKADGADSRGTFRDLAEGTQYFHIRAVDKAGNWGPASHFRFSVDNTPPKLGKPEPVLEDGSPAEGSACVFRIPVEDPVSGIDFESMKLLVDGRPVTDLKGALDYDPDGGYLTWQWCRSSPPFRTRIETTKSVELGIEGLHDYAGNVAASLRWKVIMDPKQDQTAPRPPELEPGEGGVLMHYSFADGPQGWGAAADSSLQVSRTLDPERQDWVLGVQPENIRRAWMVRAPVPSFTAKNHPVLYFQYRLPKNMSFQIVVEVDKKKWAIAVSAPSRDYEALGAVEGGAADGEWHAAVINLYELLSQKIEVAPGTKPPDFRVSQVLFGSSAVPSGGKPAKCLLDNVAIVGTPSAALRWDNEGGTGLSSTVGIRLASWDPTGIQRTLAVIDRVAATVPAPQEGEPELPRLSPGIWFLHARVQVGAGNWSATTHCPIFVPSASD